jgi:hypothetical protein
MNSMNLKLPPSPPPKKYLNKDAIEETIPVGTHKKERK